MISATGKAEGEAIGCVGAGDELKDVHSKCSEQERRLGDSCSATTAATVRPRKQVPEKESTVALMLCDVVRCVRRWLCGFFCVWEKRKWRGWIRE